jgi:hypothetical protein
MQIWLAALCYCHYFFMSCVHFYSYLLPFLGRSIGFLSGNLFLWQSERPRHQLRKFSTQPFSSIPYWNSNLLHIVIPVLEKCLAACKVWITLRMKWMHTIISEQHGICCGRRIKPNSSSIAGFYSNILIVSSCIILEHNMNYQNVPLFQDF